MNNLSKGIIPLALAIGIMLAPVPQGLAPHAWYFFAIFAGVTAALMLEPVPGALIGLLAVTIVTVFSESILFSPAELAKPGFKASGAALNWALSGFSNSTVWLIFGAFMFALGYEKTGFGRRIALLLVKAMGKRTLTLGYAIAIADTILAPFTPSNTARSGGTIFPVIRSLPLLYGSMPNDPSARKIGSYLMWTAISSTCVTSSMFLTGLAPNLLALEIVKKTTKIEISWMQWFTAFAPVGILLLLVLPLLIYILYPPQIKESSEVQNWASGELKKIGAITKREITLALSALLALTLWIFCDKQINPTTVALIVICIMLLAKVVTWDDMLNNRQAWNTLVWFATLVALADGLNKTGFVQWFAGSIASHMLGFSPIAAMIVLITIFFFTHYMFASVSAHVTAMLPAILAVGATIPALPMQSFVLMLMLTLGIMGILTPYATGPSPVYYGSGYLPTKDFWRLGAIFGAIFLAVFLVIGVPYICDSIKM